LQGNLNQVKRDQWDQYFAMLKQNEFLDENDLVAINEKVVNTQMQKLNVCPGVRFKYTWAKEEAILIDSKSSNAFANELLQKINDVFAVWE
jgi:hypothetical protein